MLSVKHPNLCHYVDINSNLWDDSTVKMKDAEPATALSIHLVEAWIAGHATENTRKSYRIDLDTFGRWCATQHAMPLAIDTKSLMAFGAARRAAGDSDATMRRRWSSLSSFYQYAVGTGAVSTNPIDDIDRPQEQAGNPSETSVLTVEATNAYLATATALDPRLDALVSMLVRDGIKLGEALALDTADVTRRLSRTSVTIRRNGQTRRVVLDESTARAVRRCAGKRTGQPLFISDRRTQTRPPQRLTRFGADHLIRQLTEATEDRVTANQLRRFYITSKHDDGVSRKDLRDAAGLAATRNVTRLVSRTATEPAADPEPTGRVEFSKAHGRRRST